VDVTTEMMSPATMALLADMAVDVSMGHENSATNKGDGSSKSKGSFASSTSSVGEERKPLQPLPQQQQQQERHNRQHYFMGENSNSGSEKNIHCGNLTKSQSLKTMRKRGPNEENYIKNHNDFVVKTINHYSTRVQSNLSSLPEYKTMSFEERRAKLEEVDFLLSRLSNANEYNVDDGAGEDRRFDAANASSTKGNDSDQSTMLEEDPQENCQQRTRESIGSDTTLGEQQNLEQYHQNPNEHPNNTTLASDVSASLLDESTVLLSEGDENENKSDNEQENVGTTLNKARQPINKNHHGKVNLMTNEEDESRFSVGYSEENVKGIHDIHCRQDQISSIPSSPTSNRTTETSDLSSIEKTRQYLPGQQYEQHEDSNILASPSYTTCGSNKISTKRCASNSGKRGSRSRYRSSLRHGVNTNIDDDEFGVENEFNLGCGNGGDDGCGDDDDLFRYRNPRGGLFMNDHEDGFSCGSPIMRRFSDDGLRLEGDSSCCSHGEESKDTLGDLQHPKLKNTARHTTTSKLMITKSKIGHQNKANESEEQSRFSYIDDESTDPVDFGEKNHSSIDDNNNDNIYVEAYCSLESSKHCHEEQQHCFTQKSQWSAFRNADPKLTCSQMGSDEENSPVRRRAIRFDSASRSKKMIPKSSSRRGRSCARDESIARSPLLEEPEDDEELEASSLEGDQDFVGMQERMADMSMDDNELPINQLNCMEDEDPIQTVRNLSRRAKELERHGVDTSLLDEVAPCDIRLKDGANFRMNPLHCCKGEKVKRREGSRKAKSNSKLIAKDQNDNTSASALDAKESEKLSKLSRKQGDSNRTSEYLYSYDSCISELDSYPDPIANFPSRVATRLNIAYEFIVNRECVPNKIRSENRGLSSAILLSLSPRQVKSVVSKLLTQTAKLARNHQDSRNDPSKSFGKHTPSNTRVLAKDYLAGGTLLVVRSKEDIPDWEVALREFTSLSVLNHSAMQSTSRKQASTASKCAGFDVVLTTYDAIKSKEATIPVDSYGCAILRQTATENPSSHDDGWMTVRTSGTESAATQPQKCLLLSILHRMSWFRVILIDELGRKGFVTKPGTARAQAAVALHSKSRFIFFEKDETIANTSHEDKFKDDRRQLRSVATALQLPETTKLDKLMTDFVLDVSKACKSTEGSDRTALSSSSDDYFSESSADNQLTDPL